MLFEHPVIYNFANGKTVMSQELNCVRTSYEKYSHGNFSWTIVQGGKVVQ